MLKLKAKSRNCLALITLMVAATVACGSGSSSSGNDGATGSGASGVDGSKRLDGLTTDEKKKLCDFQAAHYGGYGKSVNCGTYTLDADTSQADCLASWPTSCAATVSQAEKCSNDATCSNGLIPASCSPLFQCLQT